jgi:hypothetical protein
MIKRKIESVHCAHGPFLASYSSLAHPLGWPDLGWQPTTKAEVPPWRLAVVAWPAPACRRWDEVERGARAQWRLGEPIWGGGGGKERGSLYGGMTRSVGNNGGGAGPRSRRSARWSWSSATLTGSSWWWWWGRFMVRATSDGEAPTKEWQTASASEALHSSTAWGWHTRGRWQQRLGQLHMALEVRPHSPSRWWRSVGEEHGWDVVGWSERWRQRGVTGLGFDASPWAMMDKAAGTWGDAVRRLAVLGAWWVRSYQDHGIMATRACWSGHTVTRVWAADRWASSPV